MIPPDTEAAILRYYHAEKWKIGTIARQLGLHHDTVRRVLANAGVTFARHSIRPSKADPYVPFILETLAKFPTLTASRLYEMVKARGYTGAPDHFRAIVRRHRPAKPAEAFLRLTTLPGEQGQVDWAHFGSFEVGNARRRLVAFVMVLSYSRRIFLRFFPGDSTSYFSMGHVAAFEAFAGCPRRLLYDNLKSAVIERQAEAIRFNPKLLELAAHYRFEPRPVNVARGNEKGRVERAIQYIRGAFFAGREFRDLDDLNAQAASWCLEEASKRPWPEDRARTVADAYEEEKPLLLALPDDAFPAEERVPVKVGKTPYARFDLNDYSVPHTHVRKTLTVAASLTSVRILDGTETVATHPRSFDKGRQIEDPTHVQALVEVKRRAKAHRGLDYVRHAVPNSKALFNRHAEQGGNMGALTSFLLRQLALYGAERVEAAVGEALAAEVYHPQGIRQVLERMRHAEGQAPSVPLALPEDKRVREVVVRPHALAGYDTLYQEA